MELKAETSEQAQTQALNIPVVSKRKYWYRDNVEACVLCGKETHYRERVYNESEKGINYTENACWGHF